MPVLWRGSEEDDCGYLKAMASVRFGVVYSSPLPGCNSDTEDFPDSPGFLSVTTPLYGISANTIAFGFPDNSKSVEARSEPVPHLTCSLCFPELDRSGGRSPRSQKHLLETEHDCPLALKRNQSQPFTWARPPTRSLDRGVFESSVRFKKSSVARPRIPLPEEPQSSDTRSPELPFLDNESHFPSLSQSANIGGKKPYKQARNNRKWNFSDCRSPLDIIGKEEMISDGTSSLQLSCSESHSKSTPVFPHDMVLLSGGGQDSASLAPYQIHAIKFLLKTAPGVFSVGIDSVCRLLEDWDNSN